MSLILLLSAYGQAAPPPVIPRVNGRAGAGVSGPAVFAAERAASAGGGAASSSARASEAAAGAESGEASGRVEGGVEP